jgi:hypothetical protein
MPDLFPLPISASITLVAYQDGAYVDRQGRTYWSDAAMPSEADALDAVAHPRPVPAPVPAEVSPLQMRRALNAAGLRPAVEAAVAAADQEVQDAWDYATTIRRDHPLLASMATQLGLTEAQIDALFRAAATL